MQKSTSLKSLQLMKIIGSEAQSGRTERFTERQKRFVNNFFVKVNSEGDILFKSPNIPLTQEQIQTLVNKALASSDHIETIKFNGSDIYRFHKTPEDIEGNIIIVFENIKDERDTMNRLLFTLGIVGFAGLLLAFLGSFFMADRALIPVKESWERQRNFVADASHELRTPLAVVQTNIELVMGNTDESVGSQTKWLENILAENKRMTSLVNNLLFLARADSNQELSEKKVFQLDAVLTEALQLFEPIAHKKNICLRHRMQSHVDFFGDSNHIKQLIMILLDNAIKYTPERGQVDLELKENHNTLEICVKDTGEGITKEHIDKIFQRFYRADKARSRANGSSGLGLAIAEWIVKEHKGSINVYSTPGKGTAFVVNIPKPKSIR